MTKKDNVRSVPSSRPVQGIKVRLGLDPIAVSMGRKEAEPAHLEPENQRLCSEEITISLYAPQWRAGKFLFQAEGIPATIAEVYDRVGAILGYVPGT